MVKDATQDLVRILPLLTLLYFFAVFTICDGNSWTQVRSLADNTLLNEINPVIGVAMPVISGISLPQAPYSNIQQPIQEAISSETMNLGDNIFYGLQFFHTLAGAHWISIGTEFTDFHLSGSRTTFYSYWNPGSAPPWTLNFNKVQRVNGDIFETDPLLVRFNVPIDNRVIWYIGGGGGIFWDLMSENVHAQEPVLGVELFSGVSWGIDKKKSIFGEWRWQDMPNIGGGVQLWADIVDVGFRFRF